VPKEEKINKNIEMLKSTEWFQQVFLKNEEFFRKDDMVRYTIGWANVAKSLKMEGSRFFTMYKLLTLNIIIREINIFSYFV
jgi:hypothetical protein